MRTPLGLWIGLFLAAIALAQTAAPKMPPAQSPIPEFEDIAQKAGLTVAHISSPDKKYIVESMSGGVGLIDCDNDGKLDIITVNGSTVERYRQGGDPMITLYHQDADLKFTDITKAAGLTRKGWGMGIAVADYDNDGLQDIFVTGYGGNALYHNLGNCKFEDVTEKAGVAGGGFSTGAAWADYDRDGRVDLFVSRYVHVDIDKLAGVRQRSALLPFQNRAGAVRAVGHAGRVGHAISQPRRRHIRGSFQEGRSGRSPSLLRTGRDLGRL